MSDRNSPSWQWLQASLHQVSCFSEFVGECGIPHSRREKIESGVFGCQSAILLPFESFGRWPRRRCLLSEFFPCPEEDILRVVSVGSGSVSVVQKVIGNFYWPNHTVHTHFFCTVINLFTVLDNDVRPSARSASVPWTSREERALLGHSRTGTNSAGVYCGI